MAFVLYDANLGGHAERYSALSQYLVLMMTGERTGDIAGELAGSPIASCRSCISCLVLDPTHMEF